MNFNKLAIMITAFGLLALTGCGGGSNTANNTANSTTANNKTAGETNAANTNGLTTTTKPETATTDNAPTLSPVVQAYYAALKNKDENAMKKVLSQEFIKSIQSDMKDDKATGSMAAYMAKTDTVPDKPVEVRNEKIEGDKASAELKGGAYLTWTKFNFIKEGGEWKLTNQYDMPPSSQPANAPAATNKSK